MEIIGETEEPVCLCTLPIEDQSIILAALHTTKGRVLQKDMPPPLREEVLERIDPLITHLEGCMDPNFPQMEEYHRKARDIGRDLAREER